MEPAATMSASPAFRAEPESAEVRARQLAAARRRATALLGAVTVLFVAVTVAGAHGTLLGYVQAGAEASMVGGVADWFAVTAPRRAVARRRAAARRRVRSSSDSRLSLYAGDADVVAAGSIYGPRSVRGARRSAAAFRRVVVSASKPKRPGRPICAAGSPPGRDYGCMRAPLVTLSTALRGP